MWAVECDRCDHCGPPSPSKTKAKAEAIRAGWQLRLIGHPPTDTLCFRCKRAEEREREAAYHRYLEAHPFIAALVSGKIKIERGRGE